MLVSHRFSTVLLALALFALAAALLWTHDGTGSVRAGAGSSDGRVVVVSSDLLQVFDRKGSLTGTTWRADDIALGPKAWPMRKWPSASVGVEHGVAQAGRTGLGFRVSAPGEKFP